ncbi:MAG: cbb3-type cytochrome c oxidase subunit 3 [Gammaproteobacteria bacterium]|nr:cbb3-type cytochrome c oxidase subunit 3 [Gammaproteobacteria bacterium]
MNSLKDYFHTDWAAMTLHDWLGMGVTIVVFFVMIGLYVYIFHPANKERLEAHRYIPLDDDDTEFHERFSKRHPEYFPTHTGTEEQK